MYYLRTKAATDAIKFTVDKKYKEAPVSAKSPAAVDASWTAEAPRKAIQDITDEEQAAMACSIENGSDCEMCSG